jgi:polysaccharide biosynthesis protein PslG
MSFYLQRLVALLRHPHFSKAYVTFLVLGGMSAAIYVVSGFFEVRRLPPHGPHPTATNAQVLPSQITLPQVTSTSSAQQPLAVVEPKAESGIAAGGGLVYLGQSDLDAYFADLQALGVGWVRWDVDWSVVQPDDATHFSWQETDRVTATAYRYGIKSLAILTYTPPWARDEQCRSTKHCHPADPATFGRFANTVVDRYHDKIQHWEVWNEPNFAYFWEPRPNVDNYASVLQAAYSGIKKADPQALVLSGGLAASGDEADGSIAPITFISRLYQLKANQYIDAVALHPYTYPALPNYQAWWNRWLQIDSIRQLMVQQGDTAKKIWLTEFGAPTGGPGRAFGTDQLDNFEYGRDFMQEQAVAALAQEALGLYCQRSQWMGPFFWYSLKDESTARDSSENFFGLLRFDGSKKPAYAVFQKFCTN